MKDKIDRSPQHDDDKGMTREMSKLKASLDLIDRWRAMNPDEQKFTWEGTSGNGGRKRIFSRLDRIYTSRKTWEITNEYKIINCNISDHDRVTTMIREALSPQTGKEEPNLNMNIMKNPLFREETYRLTVKLENQIRKYHKLAAQKDKPDKLTKLTKLRSYCNPQKSWMEYKDRILAASETVMKSQ